VNKKGLSFAEVALFTFIFLNIMTLIHELGHFITLRLFGCHAALPVVWFYFGATPFECDTTQLLPIQWWLVAYAGALFAGTASYLIWTRMGKDSVWRIAAIVGFLYGVLPNLVWQIQGTDAYFAVSMGFPPAWATFVMIAAMSFVSYLIYKEIAELE